VKFLTGKMKKAAPPELSFFQQKTKKPHRDWSWLNETKNSPWELNIFEFKNKKPPRRG
jgi:hypothetical protein